MEAAVMEVMNDAGEQPALAQLKHYRSAATKFAEFPGMIEENNCFDFLQEKNDQELQEIVEEVNMSLQLSFGPDIRNQECFPQACVIHAASEACSHQQNVLQNDLIEARNSLDSRDIQLNEILEAASAVSTVIEASNFLITVQNEAYKDMKEISEANSKVLNTLDVQAAATSDPRNEQKTNNKDLQETIYDRGCDEEELNAELDIKEEEEKSLESKLMESAIRLGIYGQKLVQTTAEKDLMQVLVAIAFGILAVVFSIWIFKML